MNGLVWNQISHVCLSLPLLRSLKKIHNLKDREIFLLMKLTILHRNKLCQGWVMNRLSLWEIPHSHLARMKRILPPREGQPIVRPILDLWYPSVESQAHGKFCSKFSSDSSIQPSVRIKSWVVSYWKRKRNLFALFMKVL